MEITYKGRQIRFAADLSTETWQARKEWYKDSINKLITNKETLH